MGILLRQAPTMKNSPLLATWALDFRLHLLLISQVDRGGRPRSLHPGPSLLIQPSGRKPEVPPPPPQPSPQQRYNNGILSFRHTTFLEGWCLGIVHMNSPGKKQWQTTSLTYSLSRQRATQSPFSYGTLTCLGRSLVLPLTLLKLLENSPRNSTS